MSEFFLRLYEDYGINLSIFFDKFDQDVFLKGIEYTFYLSISSIIISVLIGVVGSWLVFSQSKIGFRITSIYIQIFRNTPPLIQLYFFYFALGPTLTNLFSLSNPIFSNVTWAIISLSLYAGSFNIEIFRSGIETVPTSTLEATEALGMNRFQTYTRVVLPLCFRVSIPALNNNLVNLIKTTANAFAIAVPEVLYASSQIWSEQLNALEMMIVLLAFYAVVIGGFVFLMGRLEKYIRVPGWGKA